MAITLVQHKVNSTSANQATVAVTVTSTTAGNPLIVGAANGASMTVTGVTDNKAGGTNIYTQATSAAASQGGGRTDVWYCLNPGGGVTSVTVTFSVSDTNVKDGWVFEVSGFSAAAFDLANHLNNGTGVGTTDTGVSVTTTSATGFVVGVIAVGTAIVTNPASGNEFTAGGDIAAGSSNAACSLISTTAAGHQPAWTDSNTNAAFCASTAAFKEGSSLPLGSLAVTGLAATSLIWYPASLRIAPGTFS